MTCHQGRVVGIIIVKAVGTVNNIRLSRQSYGGSGDLGKGIRTDIATNPDRLQGLLIVYATAVAGMSMIYDAAPVENGL